jgi:AraC-like DNA-binding protein
MDAGMNFITMRKSAYRSVEVRAGEDITPGKIADNLHEYAFLDERAGRMHVDTMNYCGATLGDVKTNGYDAVTETTRITVLFPMLGHLNLQSSKTNFEFSSGNALLVQPGSRRSRVRTNRGGQFRMMGAILPPPPGSSRLSAELPSILSIAAMPEALSLQGFMQYAFREAQRGDNALFRPLALKSAGALVTDMVHALYDRLIPTGPALAGSSRVRAAEDYMRSHSEEPLTVTEIANAVGVGPRALQAAFRASHGVTPRQLLAEIRLEKARARLLAPEAEMTVTDAALASGFAHFGRFAAAYRERYGELPSETLRRALNQ